MMAAAKRERRATLSGADAADSRREEPQDIPVPRGKASSEDGAFVKFKLEWLNQVATLNGLPPISSEVAILIATEFLNRKTLDAWPSVETIAGRIGRSVNAVRAALHAMDTVGLMEISTTVGGKGQRNRYRPTLIPSKKHEGMEDTMPALTGR